MDEIFSEEPFRSVGRFLRFITYGVPFRRPIRSKMYIRARTLARPRRKISGHHRI